MLMRQVLRIHLMILCWAAVASADPITIVGGSDLVLQTDGATAVLKRTLLPKETAPAKVVIGNVTRDGTNVSSEPFSAWIETSNGLPELSVAADTAQLRVPGKYTIAMIVPASGTQPAQALTITLTRPAAELHVDAPLKYVRTIRWPYDKGSLSAPTASLRENSARSTVTPAATTLPFTLRGAGNITSGQGTVTVPPVIGAGQQATETISITSVPLGSASGTVTIAAPELATGKFEQTIEVITKLAWWFLVLAIAIGILAGYYVRVVLERQRLYDDAMARAVPQAWRVQNTLAQTADPTTRARLKSELDDFWSALQDPDKAPAAIDQAANTLVTNTATIVQEMNVRKLQLATTSTDLRQKLGRPEALPASIAAKVSGLLKQVAEQETNADISAAIRELTKIETAASDDLRHDIVAWKHSVDSAVATMGDWPEIEAFTTALEKLKAPLPAAGTFDGILSAARDATAILRDDIAYHATHNVVSLATTAASVLREKEGKTSAIEAAITSLKSWSGDAASDPEGLAARVQAVRDALKRGIDDVATARGSQAMTGSNFMAASKALPEPPIPASATSVPKVYAFGMTAAGGFVQSEAPSHPPLPSWTAAIVIDGDIEVERYSVLRVQITPPQEADDVTWFVDNAQLADHGHKVVWTPQYAGPVQVVARVKIGHQEVRVTQDFHVADRRRYFDSEKFKKAAAAALRKQTVVAGAIIVAGGVLIFQSSFVGTFNDLFTAFLWGFATDIGIAKVMQLATPLTNKALPTA